MTTFVLLDKHHTIVANVVTGVHRQRRPGFHPRPAGTHPDDVPPRVFEQFALDVRLDVVADSRELIRWPFLLHRETNFLMSAHGVKQEERALSVRECLVCVSE